MKPTLLIGAAIVAVLPALAAAQETRPYTNGQVVQVSYIRVKPGQFDEYMRHLGGMYRKQLEAFRKAGLVTDFKVYAATPRSPSEANVILTVTYPNMAAFDRSSEFDAIGQQVAGSFTEQNKGFADRGAIREVLGSELVREVVLK